MAMDDKEVLTFGKKLGMIKSINISNDNSRADHLKKIRAKIDLIITKLQEVFEFLEKNRNYNMRTQHVFYSTTLCPSCSQYDKISALLHSNLQTQAKASIDSASETWKKLYAEKGRFDRVTNLQQLENALKFLGTPDSGPAVVRGTFDSIWNVLVKVPGFGPKTAALFIKAIIDIHKVELNKNLRFFDNFSIEENDFIRVPVDSVIIFIFHLITGQTLSFDEINDLIFVIGSYTNTQAAIWDDLWFWGFITQYGGGNNRMLKINGPKFWTIYGSPKEEWSIVESLAGDFIRLLS
jgi:hypothetical protein